MENRLQEEKNNLEKKMKLFAEQDKLNNDNSLSSLKVNSFAVDQPDGVLTPMAKDKSLQCDGASCTQVNTGYSTHLIMFQECLNKLKDEITKT